VSKGWWHFLQARQICNVRSKELRVAATRRRGTGKSENAAHRRVVAIRLEQKINDRLSMVLGKDPVDGFPLQREAVVNTGSVVVLKSR
jgi:hypothetical protein